MSFNFNKHCSKIEAGEILLAYKGKVTAELITNTLSLVETKIENTIHHSITKKKVYNVLVESLQNLFHHVDDAPINLLGDGERKFGMFSLSKNDSKYIILIGNFVKNESKPILKARIDKINGLTKEELKEFYKSVLNNQKFSEKGGGGLGLIDIARKTGNKIVYEFEDVNEDFSFFSMEVFIEEKEVINN